ncbi:thiamine phosphate synthase [Longimicrobium sp.]|uniref:thiamine phosphate synthase n=1 Tax=Longimicrobium sp. TaxID=2029185 RepID=UPI002F920B48
MARPDSLPPLHIVTDDEVVGRTDFADRARLILEAGGRDIVFHLRAPRASGRRLHDLADVISRTADGGAVLLVNERIDVALAAADGAQVGARGVRVRDAWRMLGPDRFVGASVHSAAEAIDAAAEGADFVVAGTIWPTPSHPGRAGAGLELIREIASSGIRVIAIGGVTPERAGEAREAGASGIAVIRGVWDAADPAEAVREYLKYWKGTDV